MGSKETGHGLVPHRQAPAVSPHNRNLGPLPSEPTQRRVTLVERHAGSRKHRRESPRPATHLDERGRIKGSQLALHLGRLRGDLARVDS
jgi:hypothetical protein